MAEIRCIECGQVLKASIPQDEGNETFRLIKRAETEIGANNHVPLATSHVIAIVFLQVVLSGGILAMYLFNYFRLYVLIEYYVTTLIGSYFIVRRLSATDLELTSSQFIEKYGQSFLVLASPTFLFEISRYIYISYSTSQQEWLIWLQNQAVSGKLAMYYGACMLMVNIVSKGISGRIENFALLQYLFFVAAFGALIKGYALQRPESLVSILSWGLFLVYNNWSIIENYLPKSNYYLSSQCFASVIAGNFVAAAAMASIAFPFESVSNPSYFEVAIFIILCLIGSLLLAVISVTWLYRRTKVDLPLLLVPYAEWLCKWVDARLLH